MTHKILADLHTHTTFSQHALSTLSENVEAARRQHQYLAVTDHLFYLDDKILRLNEISRITSQLNSWIHKYESLSHVIPGVEANLNHTLCQNNVEKINSKVKWRLVGCHSWYLDSSNYTISELPDLFEKTFTEKSLVTPTAFAHIERGLSQFQYGEDIAKVKEALCNIVELAVKKEVFLEINNHSLDDQQNIELMKFWVNYAKTFSNAKFCFGTDAHISLAVGDFTNTCEFLDTIGGLNSCYIINSDEKALKDLQNTP